MPNSLEFAKKFVPVIDGIYKAAGLTEGMDSATQVDFTGVNEVKVLKVSTTGLGEYDRSTGYPAGDITASWETISLAVERGKELSIDRMDNEETLGLVFGEVTGQFMREYVIPELDAYRFSKYASTTGISKATAAVLTADDILESIDEAVRQMDEDEVPLEGRRLYINSDLKPILNAALTRQFGSDSAVNTVLKTYNDMPIVYVPKKRFYTAITLNDGSASWGYAKGGTAKDINFMIIYPQSILQAKKFALPKIFTPDENQTKDAWKFQFRLYHDCYVYENKVKGIYLHPKA
jgi:hypothetical protein